MTTIIAVETDAGVQIACDSMASGGDKIDLEQPKVFTNNGVTYGVAGTVLYLNQLRHTELPPPPEDGSNLDHWVTMILVPVLREAAEAVGLPKNDDGEYEAGVLLASHGKVYEINGNLGWVRNTSGRYSIGSGSFFAIGAMSAGASVEEALAIAARHDPSTGYRMTVTDIPRDREDKIAA